MASPTQNTESSGWSSYLPSFPKVSARTVDLTLRAYNFGVAALVTYQYFNPSPDGQRPNLGEYAFDVGIHALNALVPANAPQLVKDALDLLDGLRATQATLAATGVIESSIPTIANGTDIINHGMNLARRW